MKILVIGDIHGENVWEEFVRKNQHDLLVFIGDYFDSFNVSVQAQIENFNQIVKYKESNPDNVILLVGNHDFQYLVDDEMYSGFNASTKFSVQYRLKKMVKDGSMVIAHNVGKYLFSHAGISQTWVENQGSDIDMDNLVPSINDILKYIPRRFSFSENTPNKMGSRVSYSGDNITQSPIWIRPQSLLKDMVNGEWHQIVGHTHEPSIRFERDLTIVDALPNEALLINTETEELTTIYL